jgi:putative DNA primase/helicase
MATVFETQIPIPKLTRNCKLIAYLDDQHLDRWINYRLKDKRPCSWKDDADEPSAYAIDALDGNNWRGFKTARNYLIHCDKNAQFGIGFVLRRGGNITVIDVDYPKEPTPESVEAFEQVRDLILNQFPSTYAETSVSGKGIHIWVNGNTDNVKGKIDGVTVEMYSHSRYMTVTGEHLDGRNVPPRNHQEALDVLFKQLTADRETIPSDAPINSVEQFMSDETVIERIQQTERGKKLWKGDTSMHGGDESSADFELCWRLVEQSWNREQVERLFLQSGLGQREKAQQQYYRDLTIDKAFRFAQMKRPKPPSWLVGKWQREEQEQELEQENGDAMEAVIDKEYTSDHKTARVDAKDRRFHTAEELRNAAQRKKFNLIDGFIAAHSITALSSFSGHRKTYVLLNITRSLLTGEPLFGYFDVSVDAVPERVVYLGDDSTMFDIGGRIEELGLMPLVDKGKLLVHTMNSEDQIVLKELKPEELKGSVVFIDTLSDFLDKEESSDTKKVRTQCRRFLRDGALAVVAAHHCPQELKYISPETVLRGHTSLSGFFTSVWFIHNQDGDLTKDAISYVELVKNRDNLGTIRPFELERGEGCRLKIYTEPGEDCAFRPQNTIVERNQDHTVKGNARATTERRKRIVDEIGKNGPKNLTKIRQTVKGDEKAFPADLDALVKDGTLELKEGKYSLPAESTTTTTNA